MTTFPFAAEVGQGLGARVRAARSVAGGDVNQAFQLTLDDGRVVFAKCNPGADSTLFPAEARGLAWLAEASALRVPRVLAQSESFLILEHIHSTHRCAGFDERLGRGLAALHRFGAAGFGLDHDNFIGRLAQSNAPASTWAEFYGARRLEPQLRLAYERGLASPTLRRGFARVLARLSDLVGPPEPPARLHGDLWGGNLMIDEHGEPCLIDPAVYAGHREVDLAMMRLFGGFSPRVFAAYDEAWPLSEGHQDRVPLYQLFYLMVHVNMFGGGYVAQAEEAIEQIV